MNLKDTYNHFLNKLREIYDQSEATVIAEWVFESVAGLKKKDIVAANLQEVSAQLSEELGAKLNELMQHRPVQYVLGEAWFYKMRLKVNEQVLIPRPETEELVELVIRSCQLPVVSRRIIDIGTGSGCIAIAIKKQLTNPTVTAIDITEGALSVAKENANEQSVVIEFKQLNFLDEEEWAALPMFDIIISNPPYIPINEKEALDKNVTDWEPHTALFVPDENPLLFYEKIAAFGKSHLNPGGMIFVETHQQYAQQTAQLFKLYYSNVEIKKDIFANERMLIASNENPHSAK